MKKKKEQINAEQHYELTKKYMAKGIKKASYKAYEKVMGIK